MHWSAFQPSCSKALQMLYEDLSLILHWNKLRKTLCSGLSFYTQSWHVLLLFIHLEPLRKFFSAARLQKCFWKLINGEHMYKVLGKAINRTKLLSSHDHLDRLSCPLITVSDKNNTNSGVFGSKTWPKTRESLRRDMEFRRNEKSMDANVGTVDEIAYRRQTHPMSTSWLRAWSS